MILVIVVGWGSLRGLDFVIEYVLWSGLGFGGIELVQKLDKIRYSLYMEFGQMSNWYLKRGLVENWFFGLREKKGSEGRRELVKLKQGFSFGDIG